MFSLKIVEMGYFMSFQLSKSLYLINMSFELKENVISFCLYKCIFDICIYLRKEILFYSIC